MHNLTAYIPMDRRIALARGAELPDRCIGAALFADVSGFTPLTRAFAEELGAKHGAEALLGVLNPLFEALIGPVHRYGGSVIGFVGDAITCWFDEEEAGSRKQEAGSQNLASCPLPLAAGRAVASALAMQAALGPLAVVRTPGGVAVTLSIKVAVAYGPARRFVVGDPAIQQIDALVGATLARMAEAEHHAEANEIVVSQEVAAQLGSGVLIGEWRGDGQFAVVTGLQEAVAPVPEVPPEVDLSEEVARPWILPAVYAQLREGTELLGDLRPATPLMLRFGGLDYDGDDAVGEKLDAFVRWVQRVVHRYTGNLLQLTIGDKGAFMYAVFGAPVAHEDDAARALRAALTLRQLPAELAGTITPLQIGLTRGEVWTGICGAVSRHVYNAVSSEVNLAARLMATAQPGQILISGSMAATPGFDVRHVGDWRYKGFADPLPTYELQGEHLAEARIFSNAMVGRAAELQQLVDFAQPLFVGRLAGAALIYGEPGIGKSRLSYALRASLGARVSWFTGQTDQILRQAFNPFVYWLKRYFDQSPEVSPAENKVRFERRLEQLLAALSSLQPSALSPQPSALSLQPSALSPQPSAFSLQPSAFSLQPSALGIPNLVSELDRTRSFLGALLGLHWPDSLYAQLDDPKLRHENTLIALKTLLLAESCLQPVVFELEDAHWLDAASQEMVRVLSRNIAAYPLLLVIASRYHDDGSRPPFDLDPMLPTLTLDLHALSLGALQQQAVALLGGPVDPELLILLWERSRATPFFTEQMLLYFRENDWLTTTPAGAWMLRATAVGLPTDVNAMLIARIDRMVHQVKQVVQAAAVLGREFDVQLLSTMLREDILPEVQQAESEQIWGLVRELHYIFKHTLLRDAAYEMQLRTRLRDLHYLAATASERLYADRLPAYYGMLAYHYETAYQLGQTEVAHQVRYYLRQAGEAAQKQFANESALEYYGKLLPLLVAAQEQLEIHLRRGAVLELIGRWAEAEQDYQAALVLARDDLALQADAHYALGKLKRRRGDYASALAWLTQAQAARVQLAEPAGLAQVLIETGTVLIHKGEYAQARELLHEGLALARKAGDKLSMALALTLLGNVAWHQGDYAAARALHEESLALKRELGDKSSVASSLTNLANVAWYQGDYAAARPLYEESLPLKRAVGDKWGTASVLSALGVVARSQGNYAAARALQEESLALKREMGDKPGIVMALNNLGAVAVAQGDYAAAQALQAECLALSKEIGHKAGIVAALGDLGLVALNRCDYAAARAFYEESLRLRREIGEKRGIAYALLGLGRVDLAEQKPSARQHILDSLRLRQEIGEQMSSISSLTGVAGLALQEGRPQFAAQLLGAIASALKAFKAVLEPEVLAFHAQTLATTRAQLGEAAFAAAWAEGEKLTLEEAVAYALHEQE